ncbi:MAG: ABC transporter ATP-binding protein [Acidimicrobiia bacterium]
MTTQLISEPGGPQKSLRATGIRRSFEGVQALDDVSLELHRHEVVGLIGPNGAGKTTLVNIVTGFDAPSEGSVELEGEDITRWTPHRRGRAGLARTFQAAHSFARLLVRENIEVSALACGSRSKEARARADELMQALGLTQHANTPAAFLPQGEERKLGVARALATRPRFLLMDEPAAGLNESEVPELAALVQSVRDEHEVGVLLIDHNVPLIMDVCDRIQVLDEGRTIATGTPEEIRVNLDVTAAYLGRRGHGLANDDG